MAEIIVAALVDAGVDAAIPALFWSEATFSLINTALFIGASYAQGADQRRRLRNQARDAFNANLQGRQVMVRSAVQPRGVLYGRDKVGGQLADAFVTGAKGEFLHLVVAYYGHECDACETIYLNNIALPAPDGSGFIQSGVFAKNLTTPYTESSGTNVGSLVLAHAPTRIIAVTQSDPSGNAEDGGYVVTSLALTTGYTVASSTVTFVPGAVAGRFYTVNYENDSTVPKVRVKVHLGAAGQTTDADLLAEAPAGRWSSNDVGTGIAYIYFRFEFDVDVFGQIGLPEPTAAWRGKKVLDPRSSTTAWSDNWALCVRDHLRDATYGLGCTSAEVIDSEINTAANIADEEVTLYSTGTVTVTNGSATVVGSGTAWLSKCYAGLLFVSTDAVRYRVLSVTDDTHLVLTTNYGGSTLSAQAYTLRQLRYTVNGTIGTEDSPLANLRKLLGPGAGTAVWVQGRWLVRAGAFISPSTTLSEDYLADGSITIVPRASRRDQCNRVSGTYLDATALYAEKQYPAQSNSTYKAADGGLELSKEASFWGVTDSYRAQRLAKIELEKSRQAMTVRMNCNHRAYDYAPSDTKNISLSRYGWAPKVFEVRSRKYTPCVGLEYTDKETASTVYTWNLGDATLYNPANATSLPNPFTAPAAIAGLACDSSATYNAALGSSLVVRGFVSWTASTDVFVQQGGQIELGWKLDNDAEWQTNAPLAGDRTSEFILPLQPARITLIRIRAVNSMGRKGPWAYLAHVVQIQTAQFYDFKLKLRGTVAYAIAYGNGAQKVVNSGAWDVGVQSSAPLTGSCQVGFTVAETSNRYMVGLSVTPGAGGSYTTIDYAAYVNGTLEIYELGVQKASGLSIAVGDRVEVAYIGGAIVYRRNGTVLRTVGVTMNAAFYLDSSMFNVGALLKNLTFESMNARPAQYRVSSLGNSATGVPSEVTGELRNVEAGDAVVGSPVRSYMMARISRTTGLVTFLQTYDVYGAGANTAGRDASTLATDLNASTTASVVVVWTYDEPQNNRLTGGLPAAMYRCGASAMCFGADFFKSRAAYILIGVPDCGPGNGFEAYKGDVTNATDAWAHVAFLITQQGQLIVNGVTFTRLLDAVVTTPLLALASATSTSTVIGSTVTAGGNGDFTTNGPSISYVNDTGATIDVQVEGSFADAFLNGSAFISTHDFYMSQTGSVAGASTEMIEQFGTPPTIGNYPGFARAFTYQLANGATLACTLKVHCIATNGASNVNVDAPVLRVTAIKR